MAALDSNICLNSTLHKLRRLYFLEKMSSKKSHDPGWNDPPIFTYDKAVAIQEAAANKKGIFRNKRVAFPIGSHLENEQKKVQTDSSLVVDLSKPPQMIQTSPLSVPFSVKLEVAPEVEGEIGSDERLKRVLENLKININCDEEITKRIKIMEKMWIDGKIEENVQYKVFKLSEALSKGDIDTADHIQMGLMVDYVSQCSSWMSGIRQLINQEKNNLDLK